jgi:hypothetical protein
MTTPAPAALNPAAPHHLPFFITPPGTTDGLMVVTAAFLLFAVVGIGVLYFKLHALPEQMAHRGQKVQFELVAVLALLALFTHNHAFWVAGLLIALIPLPDLTTPLGNMARSLERIADTPRRAYETPVSVEAADTRQSEPENGAVSVPELAADSSGDAGQGRAATPQSASDSEGPKTGPRV